MVRSKGAHSKISIHLSSSDDNGEDGIFRISRDSPGVRSSRRSKGPSLPVSLSSRRWYNFHGYFPPEDPEYDFSFRRHKHRTRFLLLFFSSLILIAVLVTLLYKGGEEIAETIATVVPHDAYVVAQQMEIPEIQAEMVLYRHKRTQAEVLTIIPSDLDQDAVFGLSVRTPAQNDRGAAHVVMHSLWDGSVMYPLKDQVHTYHKGSLATLVDATCLEDRTLFTVASRNSKDFGNLVSLLVDALFHPLLRVEEYTSVIFREEGWRLEPIDGKNFEASNQKLRFNGQTLNIQKATYNNIDDMMTRYARRALFPDTHYQFDARGVPMDIIDLSKVDLLHFYDEHYVATNTQVFIYGSTQSIQNGLDAFDKSVQSQRTYLHKMEKSVPQWQPFTLMEAAEEIHAYPIEQGDNEESHTMVSWLLNDSHMSHKSQFAWLVLEYLLMGTPASVLRQGLEEYLQTSFANATLSTQVVGGLDIDYQQWRFCAGVKGVARNQARQVQSRIDFILGNIMSFDTNAIAAAMNVVEMRQRDLSSGSQPRGVLLFRRALTEWNYNRDVKDPLAWSPGFDEFKEEIFKNGDKLLVDLVHERLVHNNHMVRIRLDPSLQELQKQRRADARRIRHLRETLSEEAFQAILDESKAWQLRETTPVDSNIYGMLPKLELSDVPTENSRRQSHFSINQQILYVETPVVSSFGMLFIDFGVDIRSVKYEDVSLLPLVYRLMLESGTVLFPPDKLIDQIGKYSSGIRAESMILDVRQKDYNGPLQFFVHDGIHLATKAVFRGSCMAQNLQLYFQILSEVVFHGRIFQQGIVIDVLNTMIDEIQTKIASFGDRFVASRLAARYTNHGLILEQLSGMSQLKSLHASLHSATSNWDDFNTKLSEVKTAIVESHRNGMIFSLTGEGDLLDNARPLVEGFLGDGIPRTDGNFVGNAGEDPHPWIESISSARNVIAPIINEALIFPMTVGNAGKGGRVYLPGTPVNGAAAVAAKYLQRVYLYEELHDKQGAANVLVQFNFRYGTMLLISLKDPDVQSTLDVFQKAVTSLGSWYAEDDGFSAAQAAIIGTIADLDGTAKQPDKIGWDAIVDFLQDDNSDFAQKWRNQILNASLPDFLSFFQALSHWMTPSVAVMTDSESYAEWSNATNMSFVKVCANLMC